MTTEGHFYTTAEQWLNRLLELNPTAATQLGEHRWDDRLSDSTPEALESQHQEMKEALAEFEGMDTDSFQVDAEIDHELMTRIRQSFIRGYEKVESHHRNPGSIFGGGMPFGA
ncbi:MAG: hypothetical protein KGY39_01770 [Anaerolineales bacterium]|nr:hypothetical protein [Anaerolineales bacterium]MBS3752449.1 hypothetical protein [Anaerolineales bacterium]